MIIASNPLGISGTHLVVHEPDQLDNPAGYWTVDHGKKSLATTPNHLEFLATHEVDGARLRWRWNWQGLDFGEFERDEDPQSDVRILIVPYWSIVTPLTLLSAWLLISKPRTKKPSEKQG